jgi:hypothetical protein
MYASKHPFREGVLVLELDAEEVLDVHGAILADDRELGEGTRDTLLSILEAAHAGTLGDRFARYERSQS